MNSEPKATTTGTPACVHFAWLTQYRQQDFIVRHGSCLAEVVKKAYGEKSVKKFLEVGRRLGQKGKTERATG